MGLTQLLILIRHLCLSATWLGLDLRMDTKTVSWVRKRLNDVLKNVLTILGLYYEIHFELWEAKVLMGLEVHQDVMMQLEERLETA